MSFVHEISSNNQLKVQLYSINGFNQDDGFGNTIDTIDTFDLCKKEMGISTFVVDFIEDRFNFV